MTILKTLIAGGQICLKRFYATSPKLIEITQDNNTGNTAISINA